MLTIEPLAREHLLGFLPIEGQEEDFKTVCEMNYSRPEMHNFAILNDGNCVLLLGMKEKWAGVFDTYTIFSNGWKPIFYRRVVRAAKGYFGKLDYDRIEHLVKCDRPWTDKMAKAFGFEYVATLRKYINGKDYKLYEVVNGR